MLSAKQNKFLMFFFFPPLPFSAAHLIYAFASHVLCAPLFISLHRRFDGADEKWLPENEKAQDDWRNVASERVSGACRRKWVSGREKKELFVGLRFVVEKIDLLLEWTSMRKM